MKKLLIICLFLFVAAFSAHAQNTLTLSTYYPAPFGSYDRLRLIPLDTAPSCDASLEGLLYFDKTTSKISICKSGSWGSFAGIWTQDASDNVYLNDTATNPNLNIGIGTITPEARLHVVEAGVDSPEHSADADMIVEDDASMIQLTGGGKSHLVFSSSDNNHWGMTHWGETSVDGHKYSFTIGYRNSLIDGWGFGGANPWDNHLTILASGEVGLGTTDPEFKLSLENDGGIIAKGTVAAGNDLITAGLGTRLIWYPKKAAFRAGFVDDGKWNDGNIGTYSFAAGNTNIAKGFCSTAMGYHGRAMGSYSTAFGKSSDALGDISTAFGRDTQAKGDLSVSMGHWTTAQAYLSVVIGRNNIVSGDNANWIPTDPLFVIGNGAVNASEAPTVPSNAMTVLKNGNTGIGSITNPTQTLHIDNILRLEPTEPPAACSSIGMLYVDTSGKLCHCNGASWDPVAGAGSCN